MWVSDCWIVSVGGLLMNMFEMKNFGIEIVVCFCLVCEVYDMLISLYFDCVSCYVCEIG